MLLLNHSFQQYSTVCSNLGRGDKNDTVTGPYAGYQLQLVGLAQSCLVLLLVSDTENLSTSSRPNSSNTWVICKNSSTSQFPVLCCPQGDSLSPTQSIGLTVPFGVLKAWDLLNMYIETPPPFLSAPFPFFACYLPARKARCIHRR